MPSKQAVRAEQKRAAKNAPADEPAAQSVVKPAILMDFAKTLVKDSFLLENAPKLLPIMKADSVLSADAGKLLASPTKQVQKENVEDKANEEDNANDESPPQDSTPEAQEDASVALLKVIQSRLTWHNALALGSPATGADSRTMWTALKSLEVDMGPRPSKRGSPKTDRIVTNLYNYLPQYLHVLLFTFMLNCLLFRSWFACLPWLFFYQNLSVAVPLDTMDKLPQVPLGKVPLKFRLAGTVTIHALVWLFFLYEAVWKCNFLIEFLAFGLIVAHALCVVPASMPN